MIKVNNSIKTPWLKLIFRTLIISSRSNESYSTTGALRPLLLFFFKKRREEKGKSYRILSENERNSILRISPLNKFNTSYHPKKIFLSENGTFIFNSQPVFFKGWMKTKVFGNGWTAAAAQTDKIFLVISWSRGFYWCATCNFHGRFFFFFLLRMQYQRHLAEPVLWVSSSISYFFLSLLVSLSFSIMFAKWKWYKLNDQEVLFRCAHFHAIRVNVSHGL